MNSRIKVVLFFSALLFIFHSTSFAANERYAYVDVAKIFDGYQKTKDQDKTLQDVGKTKEQGRDALVQDIRKMKDELALLSEDAKGKKQESLDVKVRELEDFDRDAKRQLGEERNKVVREIFKDIDDVVKRFGERKGFDLILNERALLYNNPRLDITEEVLKELNSSYKKK